MLELLILICCGFTVPYAAETNDIRLDVSNAFPKLLSGWNNTHFFSNYIFVIVLLAVTYAFSNCH